VSALSRQGRGRACDEPVWQSTVEVAPPAPTLAESFVSETPSRLRAHATESVARAPDFPCGLRPLRRYGPRCVVQLERLDHGDHLMLVELLVTTMWAASIGCESERHSHSRSRSLAARPIRTIVNAPAIRAREYGGGGLARLGEHYPGAVGVNGAERMGRSDGRVASIRDLKLATQ
jgi:hypothetical protein